MEENKVTPRWSKAVVTDIGTAMLAEYAAGRILNITAAYGSIGADDNLIELKELPDGRAHPLTIESVTRTDSSVTACIQVTSLGNSTPYKMERIGLYAITKDPGETQVPDVPGGGALLDDKLLMVVEDTEDEQGRKGVTVPAETDQLYTFKLYAVLTVTNKERLEVSVSSAGIATMGAIEDAMKKHEADPNAHPALAGKSVETHNNDPEAHPGLTARMLAAEMAMNGSKTILASEGDPTSVTVGAKGQHYINLKTGTEWECTDVTVAEGETEATYVWDLVSYTGENFKSLRTILAEAMTTANLAKDVADGAAKAIAAVQNTISVVPSQSGSLTYNGGAQLPSWNNLALEMMTITYGEDKTAAEDYTGETNAGTYKAYVTPKEGYTWGDKSAEEKEIPWTIQRATITTAPSVSAPLSYTGEAQTPIWQNFNPAQLTKTETAQTNAGQHSSSFTPTANYQWSGGDTSARVIPWTIEPAANTFSITPSGAQSLNVGGNVVIQVATNSDAQITAAVDNTSFASVTVDQANKTVTITGLSQGTANVTIASAGSSNYTDANASISVSVSRIAPTFSISPSGAQSLTIGGSKQITVTTNSDGTVAASSSAPGVATASANGKIVTVSGASAGNATITISVPQTTKYNAASLTVSVSVAKPSVSNSTWDDIKAISDAGTAASYFAAGDTKSVTLNGTVGTLALNNLAVDVFILGINHNASKEGNNRIHWAIGKISGTQIALCDSGYGSYFTNGTKYFNMNHWGNANYGGWKGCDLRYDILGSTNKAPSGYGSSPQTNRVGYDPTNYDIVNSPVANTLMAALPQALRKVMKTVTKYTDNTGNANQNSSSAVTTSVDYIFLLSEFEVYAAKTYANDYEKNYQAQYDYFKAGNAKDMYKHDARTTRVWARLRSATCHSYYNSFAVVGAGAGGGVSSHYAHDSGGVFAGFST